MLYVFTKDSIGVETTSRKMVSFLTLFDEEGSLPSLDIKIWVYAHSDGNIYNSGYEITDGSVLLAGYRNYEGKQEFTKSNFLPLQKLREAKAFILEELEYLSEIASLEEDEEWNRGWSMPLIYTQAWDWLADQFQDWTKVQRRREERQEKRLQRILGKRNSKRPRRGEEEE